MAISRVGVGAQVAAAAGAAVTATWPSGYTPVTGHFAVVYAVGKSGAVSGTVPAAPAGWTNRGLNTRGVAETITTYWRVLDAADLEPSFTPPPEWNSSHAVQMAVWSGVNTSTPFDVSDFAVSNGAAATFTPTGLTTVTNGAVLVSFVATNDDNALNLSAANGFTDFMSGAAYDSTLGTAFSVGVADKTITTAGAATCPTWNQTINGTDNWLSITQALRPSTATAYSQSCAGVASFGGAVVRRAGKPVAGSASFAGAVVRRATKLVSGAASFAGAASRSTLRAVTAAVSFAGVVVRSAKRSAAGAITPTGAAARTTARAVSGVVAPTGALVRLAVKALTAGLSFVGGLARTTARLLTGAITPAAALAAGRLFLRSVAGALTPGGGALNTSFIPAPPPPDYTESELTRPDRVERPSNLT